MIDWPRSFALHGMVAHGMVASLAISLLAGCRSADPAPTLAADVCTMRPAELDAVPPAFALTPVELPPVAAHDVHASAAHTESVIAASHATGGTGNIIDVDTATRSRGIVPALATEEIPNVGPSFAQAEIIAAPVGEMELAGLVASALASNPDVRRLQYEAAAAWQRVPQARALPDPMAGGTVFGQPMEMVDGNITGTFMVSQAIPWFAKLNARGQQLSFEALALARQAQAAELRVAADVKDAWYRRYLLDQQLRINEATRKLIESLAEVAVGRVRVGAATQGDVLLATLELSRLEEERLMLRQQFISRSAVLSRLLNRPSNTELPVAEEIVDWPAQYTLEELRGMAYRQQPTIAIARLRTEATAWGIRVAALERVPEVTVSYEQMFMSPNDFGDIGPDPWQIGVGINVPLWQGKYRAMRGEATQQHLAARASVEDAVRENDTTLLDFLEQVETNRRTVDLYRHTILPQARQTLQADERGYSQGEIEFDRVIADTRNLLLAEVAYYRSLTDWAISQARLEQAVGGNLPRKVEQLAIPPAEQPLPQPAN